MQILTGTGRLVGGHPMRPNDKDYDGNPLVCKDKITPRIEYYFALAIPKTDPCIAPVFEALQQVAAAGFPGGQHKLDGFAWKTTDGDDPKHADKEGYPGHWVFNCKDGFLRDMWDMTGKTKILEEKQVKRGDFIRVHLNIQPNGQVKKYGLYLNFDFTQLVCYGDEIISGPDGAAILADAPAATIPTGGSTTPVGSTGMPGGGPGATKTPAAGGPGGPAAGGPGGPAAGGVQPADDFLAGGPGGPEVQVDPNGPPAGFEMTAAAGAYTYKQYLDTGKWTHELLLSKGRIQVTDIPF